MPIYSDVAVRAFPCRDRVSSDFARGEAGLDAGRMIGRNECRVFTAGGQDIDSVPK